MNEQQQDKEFEAFLAGKSKLKRPYRRLGNEQPPAAVDQQILAEARRVAETERDRLGPRGGWLKPAALVATVLLSFSVVMNIGLDSTIQEAPVSPALQAESTAVEPFTDDRSSLQKPADRAFVQNEMVADAPAPTAGLTAEAIQPLTELNEITVTTRKQSLSSEEMPVAIDTADITAISADPAAALLIVAEYVAMSASRTTAPEPTAGRFLGSTKVPSPAADSMTAEQSDPGAVQQTESVGQDDTDPESLLREIARLDEAGEQSRALSLLDTFRDRFPEHPVSVKLQAETEQP